MAEEHKIEEQVISILLASKESAADWLSSSVGITYFDKLHNNILSGIIYAQNNNVQLTREAYRAYLNEYKKVASPNELAAQVSLYNRCLMQAAKKDELPILLERVRTHYIERQTNVYLGDFKKNKDAKGIVYANKELTEDLASLAIDVSEKKTKFISLNGTGDASAKDKFIKELFERRNNPLKRITCGISEIDGTMNVGFREGHLTLFTSDVSAFKTTIMINVGVNIHKLHGMNVLYVPLEMDSSEIITKIVAKECKIDSYNIEHAEKLTEQQIQQMASEFDKWNNKDKSFAILDMSERTKVSTIRREIEKRISYYEPKVVIVDYADNLVPDVSRAGRNDLELNDMLEDMRKMGKSLGFSVISAAQLSRDALKKVQDQQPGKQRLGSTDIRGGQVYTANADNVYAQIKDPQNPEQLIFFAIKCRHGKTTFSNKMTKTVLRVRPEFSLIESCEQVDISGIGKESDVLSMVDQQPDIEEIDDSPF